ncbi:hypothetical protein [Pseudomonas sp. Irchel s3h9]|uniref:hypothetical protein n=1 Tax=Pseudomonas sp. Irchel s3h9 TaxID=2009192 RepID=UPI000BA3C146|nr:hypothetical protein [Pseudomonas sp. Irchel s3h9]
MLTDEQARVLLKELIEKYLKGNAPDYDHMVEVVQDPSRQIPTRGILEGIRRYNMVQRTQQELELINDLLYMYG